MARVIFAATLARRLPDADRRDGEASVDVAGGSVGEALDAAFDRLPALRGYVLDERGAVRHHVAVFVDGRSLRDKRELSQPIGTDAEVHVIQALSGG